VSAQSHQSTSIPLEDLASNFDWFRGPGRKDTTMLTNPTPWSLGPGKTPAPSRRQATGVALPTTTLNS
jgi:hypothetical protein